MELKTSSRFLVRENIINVSISVIPSPGAEAAELFIREACALLRLAPLSPLAGGVLAGARVLPALHDIRAKMTHPHVIAAWADDHLPLEVTMTTRRGLKNNQLKIARIISPLEPSPQTAQQS